jgi:hypothetical protein
MSDLVVTLLMLTTIILLQLFVFGWELRITVSVFHVVSLASCDLMTMIFILRGFAKHMWPHANLSY